jgi:mannosylfructose-phosphate synthase
MFNAPAELPLPTAQPGIQPVRLPRFALSSTPTRDFLNRNSTLPRIGMISTHGYVAAVPPLGAADTGGQVVYLL